MNKRKICFVTGSRAEYGLLLGLMKKFQADPEFEFQLVVTGSHLSKKHGSTYRAIEADGFKIDEKLDILTNDDSVAAITESLGKAVSGFGDIFRRLKPELLVLFGDRYEIFAAAQAALIAQIPIAHLAGGDSTEGAFDEALRHGITKMSHLHFVTNLIAARRLRELGEDPRFIFNFGSPAIDLLMETKFLDRKELEAKLGFCFRKKNLLVTFHPVTLETSSGDQFQELLTALGSLGENVGIILTRPNADTEHAVLNQKIDQFILSHPNTKVYDSLGQQLYWSVMKEADVVVGNSSSGLYEAPSLKKATVNIGNRQKGRSEADSIINCEAKAETIRTAIETAFTKDCSRAINPYGAGGSVQRIYEKIKEIKRPETLLKKRFFDVLRPESGKRVYIIAEAGVNHNGSLETAKKMVEVAALAGADAIKFQTFRAEKVVTVSGQKAEYQKRTTSAGESQLEMLKKLELNEAAHRELFDYCRTKGIEFLSTPFDEESVEFLVSLGVKKIKVPSGELTNAPLLLKVAGTGLPVILSTGMSSLEEIQAALSVLAFGFLVKDKERPSSEKFSAAYYSPEGFKVLREKVTLLHCTTEYPTPSQEVNLSAMDTLWGRFALPTGFSDHSEGIEASLTAAGRGALIIEKHFTLDKNLPGPDQKASLEPLELKALVGGVRQVEKMLGCGGKQPTTSELKNRSAARRSLVTATKMLKGEIFTETNLAVKRPGTGISPFRYWDLLGKRAGRNYEADEVVI